MRDLDCCCVVCVVCISVLEGSLHSSFLPGQTLFCPGKSIFLPTQKKRSRAKKKRPGKTNRAKNANCPAGKPPTGQNTLAPRAKLASKLEYVAYTHIHTGPQQENSNRAKFCPGKIWPGFYGFARLKFLQPGKKNFARAIAHRAKNYYALRSDGHLSWNVFSWPEGTRIRGVPPPLRHGFFTTLSLSFT